VRIVVAGGGIGGLALAIALGRRGMRCVVLERDRVLGSAGGGLQLSPNGTAVLRRLGLDAVLTGSFQPAGRQLRRWRDGGLLGRVPLGRSALSRYGDPYVTLRRATLRRVLYEAAVKLPGVVIGLGTAVSAFPRADLVVGADGLHSVIRPHLVADRLRFSGHVAYRAVLPASVFSTVDVVIWFGPGQHCVCYPIDEGRSLNVVATLPAPAPPPFARGVRGEELLAAYADWEPTVRGLLGAARSFDRHPLFERPAPGPRVGRGLALMGDAALPMLPFLAQGACQALEDADSLARRLAPDALTPDALTPDALAPEALAGYAVDRGQRAERIAAASRAGARDNHLADGPEQRQRDRHLAGLALSDLDWLYAPDGRVPA
jgi:salicylate hydroxylase